MTVTVFIFLLDNLPGFEDAFSSSVTNFAPNKSISIDNCDPTMSNSLWREIRSHTNYQTVFKHSGFPLEDTNKLHLFEVLNHLDDVPIEEKNNSLQEADENKREHFPANPLCLVAIFETLSNVTAQTCGGVLLNTHWVLTAASCLNVLPYLYENGTKYKSYHTVIANSTNPLAAGSVHSVTQIVLHPKHNASQFSLALLKIEPSVIINPLKIYRSSIVGTPDVVVYGWSVYKNSNGTDVMMPTQLKLKIFGNFCLVNKNISSQNDPALCLFPLESSNPTWNNTQMNSGGPVLMMRHNKMYLLGVGLIDRVSYVVTLSHCYEWINNYIT